MATRQETRLDAREARRWRRELAEKDRERLYQLFEQMVGQQRELYDRSMELLDQPAPQTRHDQAGALDAANKLALLAASAEVLGAGHLNAGLTAVVRDLCRDLRLGPVEESAKAIFPVRYNEEASNMRGLMEQQLTRLRSE